jgi:hypothetical protein
MNCRRFRLLVLSSKHILPLANHKAYPSELFWTEALFNKMKEDNYAMVMAEVWYVGHDIFFSLQHIFQIPGLSAFRETRAFSTVVLFVWVVQTDARRNDRQRGKDITLSHY